MKKEMKKKNWIANAIKKPGALKAELGVKKGSKIPAKTLAKAAKKGGKEGQRARLAETLKSFKHKKMDMPGDMYKRAMKKKMTLAQDKISDMKAGRKEGSKADIKQDRRNGIKDKKGKKKSNKMC